MRTFWLTRVSSAYIIIIYPRLTLPIRDSLRGGISRSAEKTILAKRKNTHEVIFAQLKIKGFAYQ